MKTAKITQVMMIILMFIFISGTSIFASEPAIPPAVHLQKAIKEGVKYPERAVKSCCTGTVNVVFAIDESGKIDIKRMSTDNKEISDDVKAQLSRINCKEAKAPFYQLYKITISFKLIG